jgi:TRAP-type C4-dicarboxylate transport system substrate-binding protein
MDAWDGLPDENKDVMLGCAGLAEYAGTWRAKEYTQFTLNGLREGGMTVQPASDQMKQELREIGETMTAEWLEDAGEDGQAIVDEFRSMQN